MSWLRKWNWKKAQGARLCAQRKGHSFPLQPSFLSEGGAIENYVCDTCGDSVLKLSASRDYDQWLKDIQ